MAIAAAMFIVTAVTNFVSKVVKGFSICKETLLTGIRSDAFGKIIDYGDVTDF